MEEIRQKAKEPDMYDRLAEAIGELACFESHLCVLTLVPLELRPRLPNSVHRCFALATHALHIIIVSLLGIMEDWFLQMFNGACRLSEDISI